MSTMVLVLLLASVIPGDLSFHRWFTAHEHGVDVQIARVPGGPPWLRGVAELAAPAGRVSALLTDFNRYAELFAPVVRRARVLEAAGLGARLHLVWHYPFPLRNRDAVVLYESAPEPDGAFLLSWRSDQRPGDPKEGVRIARVAGETRIEPVGPARCRVTYTYLGDLGGKFPGAAQEKAWKAEPVEYIRALRRGLDLPDPPQGAAGGARSRGGLPVY